MSIVTHIVTVPLENKPGSLASVTRLLGKEGVNIDAFTAETVGELGFLRIVTANPEKASKVLTKNGYPVSTSEILEISVPNKPGELSRVCETLAKANVNIESAFGAVPGNAAEGRVLIRVNNAEAARRALGPQAVATVR